MQAVILIGIPGSGKTTFYKDRFADTHVHISLDEVGTRERERLLLKDCLAARRPFVVDNTNVTSADRAVYIAAAKSAGYQVTGFFFPTEPRTAIARNSSRGGKKVPVPAILRAYKRLEKPTREEGFDELLSA
jgi:predicted kinase